MEAAGSWTRGAAPGLTPDPRLWSSRQPDLCVSGKEAPGLILGAWPPPGVPAPLEKATALPEVAEPGRQLLAWAGTGAVTGTTATTEGAVPSAGLRGRGPRAALGPASRVPGRGPRSHTRAAHTPACPRSHTCAVCAGRSTQGGVGAREARRVDMSARGAPERRLTCPRGAAAAPCRPCPPPRGLVGARAGAQRRPPDLGPHAARLCLADRLREGRGSGL